MYYIYRYKNIFYKPFKKEVKRLFISNEDFFVQIEEMKAEINRLNKTNKKNLMTISMLTDELTQKTNENSKLTKQFDELSSFQKASINALIDVMDDFENIYKYARTSNNESLIANMTSVMKLLKNKMSSLNIKEIATIGETFNPELHECIQAVERKDKNKYEIIDTIKKGYIFNENVIRIAKVVAVK